MKKYEFEYEANSCWLQSDCQDRDSGQCQGSYCTNYRILHYLFKTSLLPEKLWYEFKLTPIEQDMEVFDELIDIKNNIQDFVDFGHNLYIWGENTGNGKTRWAIKLMQQYFGEQLDTGFIPEQSVKGIYMPVTKYLADLKLNMTKEIEGFNRLRGLLETVDLVIWDDIGADELTSFEMQNLFALIDWRVTAELSNIYTSNISPEKITKSLGRRLASRVIGPSKQLEIVGPDRRENRW